MKNDNSVFLKKKIKNLEFETKNKKKLPCPPQKIFSTILNQL